MTIPSASEARGRSLRDDLLDDLRQGSTRTPGPGAGPGAGPASEPRPSPAPSTQTPTVELRITPRSWSPAEWRPLPRGGGFVLSVGPVRLSLGLRKA